MPYQPQVFYNALVVVGTASADISDHVTSLTLTRRFELLEDTRMGLTAKSRIPGLEEWQFEVEIIQDFQSTGAGIEKLLAQLSTSTSAFPIRVRGVNANRSSDNPEYSGNVFLESWTPFRGNVGELLKTTVPFVSAGNITRTVTTS